VHPVALEPIVRAATAVPTIGDVEARCWSDYLCPWCYVGQARDAIFEGHGVAVVHLPYELHPEIPVEGRPVSPTGRLAPTFDRVAEACHEVGLPFRPPVRMPNTHRALATAEWVRQHAPSAFAAVHRELFAAHFSTGLPIDDLVVLERIVAEAGVDADDLRAALASGRADALLVASMAEARRLGISSTPSWVVNDLVIPGALDPETLDRWVGRVAARARPSS